MRARARYMQLLYIYLVAGPRFACPNKCYVLYAKAASAKQKVGARKHCPGNVRRRVNIW